MAMTILWRGLIVTTPPGSGGDIVSRTIAQAMTEPYSQQVVVENRPGAGGLIGQQAIFQASADGYTIGLASTAHGVAPNVGPASLPRELVQKLHDDMVAVLQRADVRERLGGQVVLAADTAPEQYATALRTEFERYGKLIDEIGLRRR